MNVSDVLYQKWEDVPLRNMQVILALLPFVDWARSDDKMNTYCKNIILKYLFKNLKIYKQTTPAQRVDLFTFELEWLRNPTAKFLIKEIKAKGLIYHSPAGGLANLTIQELAEADTRLSRYLISNNSKYLNGFLACLYRPEGEGFSAKTIGKNALILSEIPEYQKISILRSYVGSRMFISRLCPDLFPQSETKAKKSLKPEDLGPMWDELIFDLANTSGYPGVAVSKGADALEALQYMNREIRIARELNKKQNA